jgi:hypothetical protein
MTTKTHPGKPVTTKGPASGHVVYAISPPPACDNPACNELVLFHDGFADDARSSLAFHCRRCGQRLTVSFTHSTAPPPEGWVPEIPV